MQRALQLASDALAAPPGAAASEGSRALAAAVAHVGLRNVSFQEARSAIEVIKFGGSFVQPVTEWDGQPVGDGQAGPVARALGLLIDEDVRGQLPSSHQFLDAIPYASYC